MSEALDRTLARQLRQAIAERDRLMDELGVLRCALAASREMLRLLKESAPCP